MPAYSINEYMDLPAPDTVWGWEGILPSSGSMLLFAEPKLGKSKLALSLAEAIADGSIAHYLGLPIKCHGKVLYIQLDTPRNVWKDKYIRCIKSKAAWENIYMLDREMPDMPLSFDIRTPAGFKWIRDEVDKIEPAVVIMDVVRKMHGADENDATEMNQAYNTFVDATKPAAMIMIAHKKKMQHGELGDGSVRGSTALTGSVDALVGMTKKALKIQARSDAPDEIAIYQQDDGTWTTNDREAEIIDFIAQMQARTTKHREVDEAVAKEFKVSDRTARKWRLSM